jgi:hypothetical protein
LSLSSIAKFVVVAKLATAVEDEQTRPTRRCSRFSLGALN